MDYLNMGNQQLEKGKVKVAKESLSKHFKEKHRQEWLNTKREEYNTLFPTYREMTKDEYKSVNSSDLTWEDLSEEDKQDLVVAIDYSEDETYLSFDEWLKEKNIITPYQEATFDDENNLLTEEVQEVFKLARPYEPISDEEVETLVELHIQESEEYQKVISKQKQAIKEELTIEYYAAKLDANPTSQMYINSAVLICTFNTLKQEYLFAKSQLENIDQTNSLFDFYNKKVEIYEQQFKSIHYWKNADNKISQLQGETMGEILDAIMRKIADIIGVPVK